MPDTLIASPTENGLTPEGILAHVAIPMDAHEDSSRWDETTIDSLALLVKEGLAPEEVVRIRRLGTTMLDGSAGLPQLLQLVDALGGQIHDIPLAQRPPLVVLRQVCPEVFVQRISAQQHWDERVNSVLGL